MQEERAAPFRYLRCSGAVETLFAYEITGSHLRCEGGVGCRFVLSSAPLAAMNESLNPLDTSNSCKEKKNVL
ncbi:hypothetical protein QQF64_030383 [Cirrhinus molitorella]|uniref:Uncharacterized protein n=1 Tax=Cirrhinus molitorella TaxID=172907 RepID=A0ABR3N363_9TELE